MSAEAWRELARDVRGAGKSAGRLGFAYMKKHPVLTLGGGAVLAGLALWRMRRPALVVKERSRFIGKLGGFARSANPDEITAAPQSRDGDRRPGDPSALRGSPMDGIPAGDSPD